MPTRHRKKNKEDIKLSDLTPSHTPEQKPKMPGKKSISGSYHIAEDCAGFFLWENNKQEINAAVQAKR